MSIIEDLQKKYRELDTVQREYLWITIIGIIVVLVALYMVQRGIDAIRGFLKI